MHLFFSRFLSGPGAFSEDRHLGAPRATQASVYRFIFGRGRPSFNIHHQVIPQFLAK